MMSDERSQSPLRFRKRYIAFAAIGLVVVWLGWGMYDALTMKPGTQVDRGQLVFDRALARAGVEASEYRESDNGWDALAKAIEIARESEQAGQRAVRARHPSSDFEYAILQVATRPLKTCSILAQSEASSCSPDLS